MEKGIIYCIVDWIIQKMNYLNLVELLKLFFFRLVKGKEKKRTISRLIVDVFIILKWILISLLWIFSIKSTYINYIVWYLIFTNVFTYFYHHTWSDKISKQNFDIDRIKRRYLNLILSISFNIFSFAYFYAVPFFGNFKWNNSITLFKQSLLFSLSKSLSINYDFVLTTSKTGFDITNIETIISFVFLTIILSSSIPTTK